MYLYDIFVLERLEHVHFGLQRAQVLRHAPLHGFVFCKGDLLDGNELACVVVQAAEHAAEGSYTDQFTLQECIRPTITRVRGPGGGCMCAWRLCVPSIELHACESAQHC